MNDTQHGGQVYQFAQTQNNSTEQTLKTVLDFSASINPIQPQIHWPKLTRAAQAQLIHYPDTEQRALTHAIAKRFSLNAQQVTLTNGISSAILQLFSELKPDTTLLFTPIYSEYQRAAHKHSTHVIECRQWNAPLPTSLTQNSVVVLVNPSTPEGIFTPPKDLEPLLKQVAKCNCWLLVDESFLPFIGFQANLSLRPQLNQHPKWMVLQSLTKYYACPGIRIGALFAAPKTLIPFTWPAWPISVLDEQFMLHALSDVQHDQNTHCFLQSETRPFIKALKQSPFIAHIYPSQANFILAKTHVKAAWLAEQLKAHRILIRDCHSFGLGENHVRIAIKSNPQNQQLITALKVLSLKQ